MLKFYRKIAGTPKGKFVAASAGFVMLALAAGGFYWGAHRSEQPQPRLNVLDDQVDLYIRDAHYTEVGDSGNRIEINADSAKFLKKENQALFDRVRMKLILPDGKVYELTADRGRLRTDVKNAEIEGSVVIHSSRGDRFMTERLLYSDGEKKITTQDDVTLTNPRFEVRGRGMTLLLRSEHITIAGDVRARIR